MSQKRKPGEGGGGHFEPILILQRGAAEWNQWRFANAGVRIDLSGADLARANLSGANLSRADLSGANLSGAKLDRANLSGANLSRADLSETDLSRLNLSEANLSEADLSGANLSGVNLSRLNLSGANLSGAILSGADLSETDLSRLNLSEASLSEANLSGANLSGVNLSRLNLSRANLSGADLSGADLHRTDLGGASLGEANLSGANLSNASLYEAKLGESNFNGADLSGAYLGNANLGEVDLSRAKHDTAIFDISPLRIYTASDSLDDANELFDRAMVLYKALGFEVDRRNDWTKGSLWQKTSAFLRGLWNSKKVDDRVRVAERIFIGELDRETTKELAKAAVDFENAFRGKKGAVAVDLGLFIFLRKSSNDGDGDTFFKRLTLGERALLDDDPALLGNPEVLFKKIKGMKRLQASKCPVLLEDKKRVS